MYLYYCEYQYTPYHPRYPVKPHKQSLTKQVPIRCKYFTKNKCTPEALIMSSLWGYHNLQFIRKNWENWLIILLIMV